VANKFGHKILTCDEEALVHLAPETYFYRRLNSGSHNRPEFQRHRDPGISLENIRAKLKQFQRLRGNNRGLKIDQVSNVMFQMIP